MTSRIDHSVGYDLSLLSSVPDPIRAVKQEEYNAGLEGGRDGRAPVLPHGASQPAVLNHGGTTIEYLGPTVAIDELSKAPYGTTIVVQNVQPWYRRKWGIIGFVVVAFIIGGAVGGAIGATHHSHPHSDINANGTISTGANSTANSTANGSNGPSSSSNSPFSTSEVGQGLGTLSATASVLSFVVNESSAPKP